MELHRQTSTAREIVAIIVRDVLSEAICLRELKLHNRTVASALAVTSIVPSGLNSTSVTESR
jgi:hypothetical protein